MRSFVDDLFQAVRVLVKRPRLVAAIAIPLALGAGRRDLVGSVVARGAAFAALGAAIGLVAAGALAGTLADLPSGLAPLDPASFAARRM